MVDAAIHDDVLDIQFFRHVRNPEVAKHDVAIVQVQVALKALDSWPATRIDKEIV